ncbi:PKD domain protein [Thermoplasmatales archaeon SCGC AB-539-C06]|nr:PKD domain protein [Thermoplasmatales archaeon SCGC AB-539-C06]
MIVGGNGPDFVGEFVYEDLDDQAIGTTISLEGAQDVTVPAGTFHSFLLSESFGSQSEICYAPEIAFIVSLNEKFALDISQFGITAGGLTNEYEMNLVKTNYDPDNNPPNKPGKPIVVDGGSTPGKEYTFKTSAIEPDGEQIYYWWDWDDESEDKWLGPFSSGEYCEASHTWGEQGSYNIRVRAKDEHDCETAWSDLLPISMPKGKSINLLHITFLQRLVNRLPFLEQLLDL